VTDRGIGGDCDLCGECPSCGEDVGRFGVEHRKGCSESHRIPACPRKATREVSDRGRLLYICEEHFQRNAV
jgi:hypothetical protein